MTTVTFEFVRVLGEDLAKGEFELPPFPDTALRVQKCISAPDSDITDLAAVVATEPALAARLMRMANSAMMRRGPLEVSDLNTAISRVGMDMVQNAAVSFASREAFRVPPGGASVANVNRLRQESVKVASLSYVIAKHSSYRGKPDEAMLAGLLHGVGKLYILVRATDHPELFTDNAALESLIGQWHTGVARAIVESWGFAENIAIAVDEQELEERDRIAAADLSDILFIAHAISRSGYQAAAALGDSDALARLRMDADRLAELLRDNEEEIQSMVEALST